MLYSIRSKFEHKPLIADLLYALFFGALSLAFGELNFVIPGIEGGNSDFREIPLIISIFYIGNPVFLIISCLITSITTSPDGSYLTTFGMHIIPLVVSSLFYKYLKTTTTTNILNLGVIWSFYIVIYYAIFLIPVMILIDQLVGLNKFAFMESYKTIIISIKFEMIATSLITGLYLVQFETRENLVEHQKNLEAIVNKRTKELAQANSRLTSMNDELVSNSQEIKSMNENLDGIVKKRSKKIEEQLSLLVRYAHMNSHEVRAPIARILGLLHIIKIEKADVQQEEVISKLCESGEELDEIVRSMNRLLEKEIDTNEIS